MAANNLVSYDLKGVKESFANWISNISPTDTPFVSMTGKEAITNKYFQWQHDSLGKVSQNNAHTEGSDAGDAAQVATTVEKNVTQILRKVVQVSDTADALSSYGRGSELAYQMEKAGAEIKRDLEYAFLHNGAAVDLAAPGTSNLNAGGTYNLGKSEATGTPDNVGANLTGSGVSAPNKARKTAGFEALVSGDASPDAIQGTVTVKQTAPALAVADGGVTGQFGFKEADVFGLTESLYEAGAQPNIIMYHPAHAKTFSGMMESGTNSNRQRMFDGASDTKINTYVATLVDPLGQEFKLIPNRFMPVEKIFVFDPSDWTQMVLRAPQRTKLAKTGSFEKWMIEMEVGLRHRNPWASGVLTLTVTA